MPRDSPRRWLVGLCFGAGVGFPGGVDYPSAGAVFPPLLTCASFRPRSSSNQNWSEFCNKRIDGEIARASALQSTDPQAASALWGKIDRDVTRQAPWVPLHNPRSLNFVSRRVGNYQHNPQWGTLLDQLWVR
jgi:peptide/nickel transport system substrate-binding protein